MDIKHPVQQRIDDFDQRHGGRASAVKSGGQLLFPDGAVRTANCGPTTMMEDPPTYNPHRLPAHTQRQDIEWECLHRRLHYHDVRIAIRVDSFNYQRSQMVGCDYSESDWVELERLQKLVDEARADKAVVEAERDEHPIHRARAAAKEQQATLSAKIAEKAARLAQMRV